MIKKNANKSYIYDSYYIPKTCQIQIYILTDVDDKLTL